MNLRKIMLEVDGLVSLVLDGDYRAYADAVENSYGRLETMEGGVELLEYVIKVMARDSCWTKREWHFHQYKGQVWIEVYDLDEKPTQRATRWWLKGISL